MRSVLLKYYFVRPSIKTLVGPLINVCNDVVLVQNFSLTLSLCPMSNVLYYFGLDTSYLNRLPQPCRTKMEYWGDALCGYLFFHPLFLILFIYLVISLALANLLHIYR